MATLDKSGIRLFLVIAAWFLVIVFGLVPLGLRWLGYHVIVDRCFGDTIPCGWHTTIFGGAEQIHNR